MKLPYLIRSMTQLKKEFDGATFTGLWSLGFMTEVTLKRVVLSKIPRHWNRQLMRNDVGNEKTDQQSIHQLVDWFSALEAEEGIEPDKKSKKKSDKKRPSLQSERDRNNEQDGSPTTATATEPGALNKLSLLLMAKRTGAHDTVATTGDETADTGEMTETTEIGTRNAKKDPTTTRITTQTMMKPILSAPGTI
jgi:hypothetical protein